MGEDWCFFRNERKKSDSGGRRKEPGWLFSLIRSCCGCVAWSMIASPLFSWASKHGGRTNSNARCATAELGASRQRRADERALG